jgi:hypothetical protein
MFNEPALSNTHVKVIVVHVAPPAPRLDQQPVGQKQNAFTFCFHCGNFDIHFQSDRQLHRKREILANYQIRGPCIYLPMVRAMEPRVRLHSPLAVRLGK